jgi:hypothetical protein
MIFALSIICGSHLLFELWLYFVSRPEKLSQREAEVRDAHLAVAAAEQFRGHGKGEEKVRVATQYLLDAQKKLKPPAARMLVEYAVSEMNKTKKG